MIMVVSKHNKSEYKQKGQALIEFIFFLPFLLMIYSVILGLGNAINASINQQKVARGYLFHRVQNNSMIPRVVRDGSTRPYQNWSLFGMFFIGWMEKFAENNRPVATCYKLNLPLGETTGDSCEEGYESETTQYIRVGTVYGLCGATYENADSGIVRLPSNSSGHMAVMDENGCVIR